MRETYQFHIEGETFHLRVDDGTVEPRAGGARQPDLLITTDQRTILELLSGGLAPLQAIAAGRVAVEGSPEVLERAVAILGGGAD